MSAEQPNERDTIFTIIDVYPPFKDSVCVYISEGPCETENANERKIGYSLPDFLIGKKPDLSHLISGEGPVEVCHLLEERLRINSIQYEISEIYRGVLYKIIVNKFYKIKIEDIISRSF